MAEPARARVALRAKPLDELRGVDVERVRQADDVHERQVALAPLDPADVGAVESGSRAQRLLGESELEPPLARSVAELLGHGVPSSGCHRQASKPTADYPSTDYPYHYSG